MDAVPHFIPDWGAFKQLVAAHPSAAVHWFPHGSTTTDGATVAVSVGGYLVQSTLTGEQAAEFNKLPWFKLELRQTSIENMRMFAMLGGVAVAAATVAPAVPAPPAPPAPAAAPGRMQFK